MGFDLCVNRKNIKDGKDIKDFSPSSVAWRDIVEYVLAVNRIDEKKAELFLSNDGVYVPKKLVPMFVRSAQYIFDDDNHTWSEEYRHRFLETLFWLNQAKAYGFFIN